MRRWRDLRRDARGLALMEFALTLPLVLTAGGYGIELANLAITNMRISQVALALADNASRIGVNNGQSIYQLREGDLNDILQGAREMGKGLGLTTYGRVTVSSVENVQRNFADGTSDPQPVQRLHWQRCIGLKKGPTGSTTAPLYDSNFGVALPLKTAATDDSRPNAGPLTNAITPRPPVDAPRNGGAIVVEVNFLYQPLFGTLFLEQPKLLHYTGTFIVRDRRDFNRIWNQPTALGTTPVPSTCDLYTA